MTIKKFVAPTKEEAIAKAREELGDQVVIMNVKEVRPEGLFGFLKKSDYEVTAAVEDGVLKRPEYPAKPAVKAEGNSFDAAADEKLDWSKISGIRAEEPKQDAPKENIDEMQLKDAFQAVSDVIKKAPAAGNKPSASTYDKNGSIIRGNEAVGQSAIKKVATSGDSAEIHPGFVPLTAPEEPKEESRPAVQEQPEEPVKAQRAGSGSFVKMLYSILLKNEVDETFINQLIEDMDKVISSGNSLDYMLSNVYQKLVLSLGQPNPIVIGEDLPHVVFLVGPTGVGKTTTIAKIASKFKLEQHKKVGLITVDTFRIAAADQLRTYAAILEVPLQVVYETGELNEKVRLLSDCDLVLVDTFGFSHNNKEMKDAMKNYLAALDEKYSRDIYLVLSATTKYNDLKDIIDTYKEFTDFSLVFTKLDETMAWGNILNCKMYSKAPLSYITNGQDVAKDMQVIDPQHLVKQLLGGS